MDSDAIAQLRALAAEARDAVDHLAAGEDIAAEERYAGLRSRASILNAEYQWASSEEFENLFPTLEARREMAALNQQYGEQYKSSPIDELLIGLWAWARGVLVPYEEGLG